MSFEKVLFVGIGGFLGSIARYATGEVALRFFAIQFPMGTLIVNFLGSLLIGASMYLVETSPAMTPTLRLFFVTGVLGGYTTFSAFSFETFQLMKQGQVGLGVLNVVTSVVLGLLAVWLGWSLMKLLNA